MHYMLVCGAGGEQRLWAASNTAPIFAKLTSPLFSQPTPLSNSRYLLLSRLTHSLKDLLLPKFSGMSHSRQACHDGGCHLYLEQPWSTKGSVPLNSRRFLLLSVYSGTSG